MSHSKTSKPTSPARGKTRAKTTAHPAKASKPGGGSRHAGSKQDAVVTLLKQPKRTQPVGLYVHKSWGKGGEYPLDLPAEKIGERRGRAPMWHMNHVDAGHHLEQLARDMRWASDTS